MTYDNKKGISPIAAGITGLILGVVGTAAVALSDKDTRKKASKQATKMKDDLLKWGEHSIHDFQKSQKSKRLDDGEKIDKIIERSRDVAEETGEKIEEASLKN